MTEPVIDLLEPVQVDEQQCDVTGGFSRVGEGVFQQLHEEEPVGQPRQRVMPQMIGQAVRIRALAVRAQTVLGDEAPDTARHQLSDLPLFAGELTRHAGVV